MYVCTAADPPAHWPWRRSGREHGTWQLFDATAQCEVERAFQSGEPTAQSVFFNPRLRKQIVYTYDLHAMQQVPAATPARPRSAARLL